MRSQFFKIFFIFFFFSFFFVAHAASIEDLKNKIEERNNTIKSLEKEIATYQNEVNKIGEQANTLKSAIASLDLTKKKIETEIKITQNKILSRNDEIEKLNLEIGNKGEKIVYNKRLIGEILKKVYFSDDQSLAETFVGYHSLSDFWGSIDSLVTLQDSAHEHIKDLSNLKANLEENKKIIEKKKADLLVLKDDLLGQTKALSETVEEKSNLLKTTKNIEANYKTILANKIAQKAQFERELFEFESALKIAIDPKSIPSVGSGVLKWPLDKVVITQYFGNTPFATKNAQIYNGKGHTGVDFGTPIGTPIKASMDGIVTGVGNTDLVRTCYSYGKWIFIKHPNGLSTLYAHLSSQSVQTGQVVKVGDTIGYSGNTGYSTGPHLHFGVYATQGVRIESLANSKNCRGVLIPLADPKAYLNPLSFL